MESKISDTIHSRFKWSEVELGAFHCITLVI
jgi:hypothetical protein